MDFYLFFYKMGLELNNIQYLIIQKVIQLKKNKV